MSLGEETLSGDTYKFAEAMNPVINQIMPQIQQEVVSIEEYSPYV